MADVKTEQEPSIEEILESIRQIISEDTEEEAKPAVPPASLSLTPAPAAPQPPPVPLSLKPEAPKPVESKPSTAPLDLTDKIKPVPLDISPPSPPTIEMRDSPMTDEDKASSLMSPETADAATDSLSRILASNVAIETERSGRPGKVTLEDIARDLMKPLIKTWLDQNLPGIIEKAVQKEVEKLSRRAVDR